ncbi:MAG: hypothetical protein ACOYXC_11550 [Candidatus Rifleibacteriota bacterium]
MDFEHLQPISSENLFFERFKRTCLLEKISHWAKLLSYGFISLTIFSMVANLVLPFGNDVPDLFMQFLFLLIFWGTIELLTLPLEHIQDFYIFDFEKNWLALSQQRFFYRRITVLAAFNQIKAIGFSAQPHGTAEGIFSGPEPKYAIFIQTLKNQLIQVSDYSLTMQEADAFCHRLYSSHFSGAAYIGGAPGMEIAVDPVSGEVKTRLPIRDFSTFLSSFSRPAIQALMAFLITFTVMNLALSIIQKTSKEFFAADLKIRNQPVFQLVFGPVPALANQISPQATVASATQTITIDLPASSPVSIDIANQQIVKIDTEKKPPEDQPAKVSEVNLPVEIPPAGDAKLPPPVENNIIDSQPVASPLELPVIQPTEISADIPARKIEKAPVQIPSPKNSTRIQASPIVYEPLTTSIPDVDFNNLHSAAKLAPATPAGSSFSAGEKMVLVPGEGILPDFRIGNNIGQMLIKLGKPVKVFKTINEIQYVFPDLTISTGLKSDAIERIIISGQAGILGEKVKTIEGIGIGSPISDAQQKLGPLSSFQDSNGFHSEKTGISLVASPSNPDKIGAIQIYRPR